MWRCKALTSLPYSTELDFAAVWVGSDRPWIATGRGSTGRQGRAARPALLDMLSELASWLTWFFETEGSERRDLLFRHEDDVAIKTAGKLGFCLRGYGGEDIDDHQG